MASKIEAGDVKRVDYFLVDPTEVVVKEELRGRRTPPSEEQIINMAESMLEHGQRTPVECRKIEGNRLLLNFGFTRTAAARLIREGFQGNDGEHKQDKEFRLKVVLAQGNDKDAFIHNIVENAHRNETTPIDDAYNHNRLRDMYGYNDADITKLYKYTDPNKVGRYRKLLGLAPDVQELVSKGSMGVQAAIDLLELPESEQATAIAAATVTKADGTVKVDGQAVRKQVRDHHLNDDGPESAKKKKKKKKNGQEVDTGAKPLSMREIRKFLDTQTTDETQIDPGIQAFCKSLKAFIGGKIGEKAMVNALNKLADYERE